MHVHVVAFVECLFLFIEVEEILCLLSLRSRLVLEILLPSHSFAWYGSKEVDLFFFESSSEIDVHKGKGEAASMI